MTRFELRNQFVEIERVGVEIHRRWGAVGRADSTRADRYADEHAAEIAWSRQLRRLEHQGYRPGRRDERFESAILRAPDDVNTYLVYADWLQEQNDARGLLISTMASGKPHDELLNSYATQFVPAVKATVNYAWKFGFIEHADFETPRWSAVRRVLRHPSSLVLKTIRLRDFSFGYYERATEWNALVPLLPPTITHIHVEPTSTLWRERGNLAPELQKLMVG